MRGIVVAALCILALAGCSESGAGAGDGGDNDGAFQAVKTTADTGGITGIVVDPAVNPVGGINVTVAGLGLTATTDAGGLFSFSEVAPGLYNLGATGPGYLPVQTTAEVVASEAVKVKIVIPFDPAPRPFHDTLPFYWFDSVGVTLVDFVIDLTDETFLGDSLPPQCDECQFFFETTGPVETFVVEAQWADSIADPSGGTSYYWTLADGEAWTNGYVDGYFGSGEPARVENNHFGDLRSMQVKMSADETWITFDQEAEIYVTMFYVAAAPDGWSFTGGG